MDESPESDTLDTTRGMSRNRANNWKQTEPLPKTWSGIKTVEEVLKHQRCKSDASTEQSYRNEAEVA